MHLIDEVVGYAKANSEAALSPDDKQTWAAHHRNCVLIQAEMERLRAALKPFGYYYELNDCQDRRLDDALEVPIADLKRAHELVGGEHPHQQTGSDR